MKKILIVILMFAFVCGCGKKVEEPIPNDPIITPDSYKEITKNINTIVLSDNMTSDKEITPYSFNIASVVLNPALLTLKSSANPKAGKLQSDSEEVSTQETENNEGNVERSINLSNEIMIKILFSKINNEIPEKVVLSDIEIIDSPAKGKLAFYQILDRTKIDYIDKMRDNKIVDTIELTKDSYGKSLENGEFELRFSTTIDSIMTATRDELIKNNYKTILQDNNITNKDIGFKISFIVSIVSNTGTYSLPFVYDSNETIDMYSDINYKAYNNETFVYFVKVK